MQNYEDIPEVKKFFDESKIVIRSIDINDVNDEKIFKMMEENFQQFTAMSMVENGYLNKLAFISAILRDNNVKNVSVKQSFSPTILGNLTETFTCNAVIESHNSEIFSVKPNILEKFNKLKQELMDRSEKENNSIVVNHGLRFNTIWQQKECIKEMYGQVLSQLNNDVDSAIALTSLFIFEIETMSVYRNPQTLFFYDLYDLSNPLDKWFAAVDISVEVKKPIIFVNSTQIH